MRKLVAFQDEAEVAYTSMASLSVDPPGVTAAFRVLVTAPRMAGRRSATRSPMIRMTIRISTSVKPRRLKRDDFMWRTPWEMGNREQG